MNEMVKQELQALTALDVKKQVNLIQEVLRSVMIKDVHYGAVPGCGAKQVLLKPGAEKIMSTFMIGSRIEVIDLSTGSEKRYRVVAHGFHTPTGRELGDGVGEASTAEEKYCWREAVCPEEFDQADDSQKRSKFKKAYKGAAYQINQIKTNPSDLANTVLKMAKKRALVDMVLTCTGASDVFEQDIDESHIAEALGQQQAEGFAEPKAVQPQATQTQPETQQAGGHKITQPQVKRFFAILHKEKKADRLQDVISYFGFESVADITMDKYEDVCNFITEIK